MGELYDFGPNLTGVPVPGRHVHVLSGTQLLTALAGAWDAAVASLAYEDGTPVEVVSSANPYRKALNA